MFASIGKSSVSSINSDCSNAERFVVVLRPFSSLMLPRLLSRFFFSPPLLLSRFFSLVENRRFFRVLIIVVLFCTPPKARRQRSQRRRSGSGRGIHSCHHHLNRCRRLNRRQRAPFSAVAFFIQNGFFPLNFAPLFVVVVVVTNTHIYTNHQSYRNQLLKFNNNRKDIIIIIIINTCRRRLNRLNRALQQTKKNHHHHHQHR